MLKCRLNKKMIKNIVKNNFLIFIFVFFLTASLNTHAEEEKKRLLEFGDLSKNNFIVAEKMYGIVFNPTETRFEVSKLGSENYCKKTMENIEASVFLYPISKHTLYFTPELITLVFLTSLPFLSLVCVAI